MILDGVCAENLRGAGARGTVGRRSVGSAAANAAGTAKGPAARSRGIAAAIAAAIAAGYGIRGSGQRRGGRDDAGGEILGIARRTWGAKDAPEDRRSRREMSAPSVDDDDDDDDALTAIPRGARCRRTRARAVTGGGGADARLIEKCCLTRLRWPEVSSKES